MNESTAMARVVVEQLLAHGVVDVVLAPGSRSTPLALLLAESERGGILRLHVRIDERSAAFLALGIAKCSGHPVAVVCTSGTAVANLAPAVVEAMYSGVPLIVITADRPPELRGVGANQTIDQVGFFGQQVRTSIDLLASPQDADQHATWRKGCNRVIADAIGAGHAGPAPVQLNIGFREPLVPDSSVELALPDVVRIERVSRPAMREPINYAVGDLGLSEIPARGVMIVGDVPNREVAAQAAELAQACGWPLISEPSGGALVGETGVPAASVFLADDRFRESHAPELVVTVGRFGISRPIMKIVRSASHHIAVLVCGKDRPDPLRTAGVVLAAAPRPPEGDAAVPLPLPDEAWLREWLVASTDAQLRIAASVAAGPLTGLAVASACWESLGADDCFFVASSRAVRNVEAAMTIRHFPPRVIGNRGASGIDGLVSTAWGSAVAHARVNPGGRTLALLGDLAFLHDQNGFLAPVAEPEPDLTVVVADNNGGGIFSSLEQGAPEFDAMFERVFGTPHDRDLVAVANATGYPVRAVDTTSELVEALAEPSNGIRIIIARTAGRTVEQTQWASLLGG